MIPDRRRRGDLYRDSWMFVVTVLVLFAILTQQKLLRDIQRSRVQALITTCEDSNARYTRAKTVLDDLIDRLPPGPQKDRARTNRAGTLQLIDALAPFEPDCAGRARRLTR